MIYQCRLYQCHVLLDNIAMLALKAAALARLAGNVHLFPHQVKTKNVSQVIIMYPTNNKDHFG
jgi:hypothetical protein